MAPAARAQAPPERDAQPGKKAGMKVTYDEYKHMANLLVLYMRRQEEESAGKTEDRQGKGGMKVTYDEYKHMANLLVLYIRRQEEESAGRTGRGKEV